MNDTGVVRDEESPADPLQGRQNGTQSRTAPLLAGADLPWDAITHDEPPRPAAIRQDYPHAMPGVSCE